MGLFADRIKVAVASAPGTGAIPLGVAASGYRSFADAGYTNGQTVAYVLEDGANWELGKATYNSAGPTLSRTTIIASSNANAAINASAASVVYCAFLAEEVATVNIPYVAKTSTYPIVATDSVVKCDTNAFTVTLPSAVTVGAGKVFYVKNLNTPASLNLITIQTTSSQTIDGYAAPGYISPGQAMTFCSDGAGWIIL